MGNVKITRFESDMDLIPVLTELERLSDEIARRAYEFFQVE